MSDSISLSVDYTTSNRKTASRTITNVSPSATDSELNSFVNDLYGLTTNSVGTVMRIAKRDLSDEPDVPLTNPIQSVALDDDVASIFTLSGSGTSYAVTAIVGSAYKAAVNNGEYKGINAGLGITLVDEMSDAYNGHIHTTTSWSDSGLVAGLSFYPSFETIGVMVALVSLDVTNVESLETGTVILSADSITFNGVKYAPWTVTFTIQAGN